MAAQVPIVDFSPLGQLGQVYQKNKLQSGRQTLLSQLGQTGDNSAIARGLYGLGDLEGGMGLAKLAAAEQEAAADRAWKQAQAAETSSYRDQMLDLQRDRMNQPPQGYQRGADGGMTFVPGGPADPKQRKRLKPERPMSANTQNKIIEADEMVQAGEATVRSLDEMLALNKKAFSGYASGARGAVASQFGNEAGAATEELFNLSSRQALEQLKATFGAAPTEGERRILLDVQGSPNQTAEVRERIYRRAQGAVKMRLEFNRRQAKGFRDGSYFADGDEPGAAATPEPQNVQGAPEPGLELDGYIFLGGDPSEPTNWAQQ